MHGKKSKQILTCTKPWVYAHLPMSGPRRRARFPHWKLPRLLPWVTMDEVMSCFMWCLRTMNPVFAQPCWCHALPEASSQSTLSHSSSVSAISSRQMQASEAAQRERVLVAKP